jgi:hypothetical protein
MESMKSTRLSTMENFSHRRKRRARWLFVWLLPFLFNGIAHDWMHGAGCPEDALLRGFTRTHRQEAAPATRELAPETECLACVWSGASTIWDGVELPFIAWQLLATARPLHFLSAPVKVFLFSRASRGPPLS